MDRRKKETRQCGYNAEVPTTNTRSRGVEASEVPADGTWRLCRGAQINVNRDPMKKVWECHYAGASSPAEPRPFAAQSVERVYELSHLSGKIKRTGGGRERRESAFRWE